MRMTTSRRKIFMADDWQVGGQAASEKATRVDGCARAGMARAFALTETKHALENPDHFFRAHYFSSRPDAGPGDRGQQTALHFRGHDEIETRRRAGPFAEWEVGRVRRGRCGPRREQKNSESLVRP